MSESLDLPWLQAVRERLQQLRANDRLPHAILLAGPRGLGKQHFLREFAQNLLCERASRSEPACGECASCRGMHSGSSSDFIDIGLPADKREINIAQVREIGEAFALGRQRAPSRVAIIRDCEYLNRFAANALLKTLEEPAEHNYLLLSAADMQAVLPTIHSRVQRFQVNPPNLAEARQWLQQQRPQLNQVQADSALLAAAQAPLVALDLIDNEHVTQFEEVLRDLGRAMTGKRGAVQLAEQWQALGELPLLRWSAQWLALLAQACAGVQTPAALNENKAFMWLRDRLDPARCERAYREAIRLHRLSATPVNQQAIYERFLLLWRECATGTD